jgi:hypothetical protein
MLQAFMKRARGMGTYFSYGTRHNELKTEAADLEAPDTKVKIDHNTTRIAAAHALLHSLLRLNRPLRVTQAKLKVRVITSPIQDPQGCVAALMLTCSIIHQSY